MKPCREVIVEDGNVILRCNEKGPHTVHAHHDTFGRPTHLWTT